MSSVTQRKKQSASASKAASSTPSNAGPAVKKTNYVIPYSKEVQQMTLSDVVKEAMVTTKPAASDAAIREEEKKNGPIPKELKEFYKITNGGTYFIPNWKSKDDFPPMQRPSYVMEYLQEADDCLYSAGCWGPSGGHEHLCVHVPTGEIVLWDNELHGRRCATCGTASQDDTFKASYANLKHYLFHCAQIKASEEAMKQKKSGGDDEENGDDGNDGAIMAMHRISMLDRKISRRLHQAELGVLDYAIVVPAMLFGTYGMPITVLFFGIMFGLQAALRSVLSALLTVAVTEPMKKHFERERPRPEDIGRRHFNLRKLLKNHAFPSGDSAQAACAWTLVALLLDSSWVVLLTVLTMFGRVYFGPHWVGDTIAGCLVGSACCYALNTLILDSVLS